MQRLVLNPATIRETDLENLFGLRATTRDPLAAQASVRPDIVNWQLENIQNHWRAADQAESAANPLALPAIDPDIIDESDLRVPAAGDPAFDLLTARRQWIADTLSAVRALRVDGAGAAAVDAVITANICPVEQMAHLERQRLAGADVQAQLQTLGLDPSSVTRLLLLRKLAEADSITQSEWDDLFSIAVASRKQRTYAQWRVTEYEKNVTLGPGSFQVRARLWEPPADRWRASRESRRLWEERLNARADQHASILASNEDAVSQTERRCLPLLRDSLLNAVGNGPEIPNALTRRLLIDVRTDPGPVTTRLDQAIETLQSALFALRMSKLTDSPELGPNPASGWVLDLAPDYQEKEFDQEWKWMGSWQTWRAAMLVFLHPENMLYPQLRENFTGHFGEAMNRAEDAGRLTRSGAAQVARSFADSLPPKVRESVQITEQYTEAGLEARRESIRMLLEEYTTAAAVPAGIQEALLHLPLYLGLQLHAAGEYLAALDWFQTVYAYQLPPGRRKIYYGLQLEETLPTRFERKLRWMLDGLNPHDIAASRANAYTRFTIMCVIGCLLDYADSEFTRESNESLARARTLYLQAAELLQSAEMRHKEGIENPVLALLQRRCDVSLVKLRAGRNIAGMQRQTSGLDRSGAGSVFLPTAYRYSVLIERSQQLAAIAQQVEAGYLAALEKRDAESYSLLKAHQDLDLAQAGLSVHNLRVNEARNGVALAAMQKQRAAVQVDTYTRWIDSGLNQWERGQMESLQTASAFRSMSYGLEAAMTALQAATTAASGGFLGTGASAAWGPAVAISVLGGMNAGFRTAADQSDVQAQLQGLSATYERRKNEWELQRAVAAQDEAIGLQQIRLAEDHVAVLSEERAVSQRQAAHADAVVRFLATKFTNAELYSWMSDVLGGVYRYFLQQACAMGRLAQDQLAFERQEPFPAFIRSDYWTTVRNPEDSANQPDRRGLTGSARLLQHLYQLDQHAFQTNRRKLQLSRTISLARLAPQEFQQFRTTGVLPFATPMELFDRDFPGHYLRLIKRVRLSVVALVPPAEGIRATLINSGLSRVVVGSDSFQQCVIRREPDSVALTSPTNASGVFDLDSTPELLLPFENTGVDTSWELQIPRAANRFDFRTLFDVLLTVEYTALSSPTYRRQVIAEMNPFASAERTFSLRQEFPDQWYELQNPGKNQEPVPVRIPITRTAFPSNLSDLAVQHVAVCLIPANGHTTDIRRIDLRFSPEGSAQGYGGEAAPLGSLVSTRRANGISWMGMTGQAPMGAWTLGLPGSSAQTLKSLDDIVLAVTYAGRAPEWP